MSAVERDQAAGSLAEALAQVQAGLPRVRRGSAGTVRSEKANYTFRYADLADISAAVLPALGRAGLAWTTLPTVVDGGRFVLAYRLLHVSGQSLAGEYPLPDPARSTPQQLGSAITFARRYALCAVTGVAPADDDHTPDGTRGGRSRAPSEPPQTPPAAASPRGHGTPPDPGRSGAQDAVGPADGAPAEPAAGGPVRMLTEFPPVPPAPDDHPVSRAVQSSIARVVARGGITTDGDRYAVVARLAGRADPIRSTGELTAAEARQVLTLLSGWDHAGLIGEQLVAILDATRAAGGDPGDDGSALPAPGTAAWHQAGHPTRAGGAGPVITVPVLRSGDCGVCEQDDHHARPVAGARS